MPIHKKSGHGSERVDRTSFYELRLLRPNTGTTVTNG